LFGSSKTQCVHRYDFGDRRAGVDEIIAWIARYNHARLHSTLGYLSLMAYEKKWLARQAHQAASSK